MRESTAPLLDYIAHVKARRCDPQTSQKAALTVRAGSLRAKVLDELTEGPLSEYEVAARLGKDRVSVSPRFAELRDMALIEAHGTKINPQTNKECIVWRLKKETLT
jgi:hypothetical protein